jgi:hypothetical protein
VAQRHPENPSARSRKASRIFPLAISSLGTLPIKMNGRIGLLQIASRTLERWQSRRGRMTLEYS